MSDTHNDQESSVVTEYTLEVKEPQLYKVLLHNDDYTTMEFVISILETIFHKSFNDAAQIMGLAFTQIYSENMLSKSLEKSLILAIREAKNHNHEYVTVEHMLYGLLHDDLTSFIIEECGGSIDTLKEQLEKFFVREIPKLSSTGVGEPAQTIAFNRVLQRAVAHVQSCGKQQVDSGDVLVAIFAEDESHAVYFLTAVGIGKVSVVNFISHELPAEGLQKEPFETPPESPSPNPHEGNTKDAKAPDQPSCKRKTRPTYWS